MKILALDSSGLVASVAVVEDGVMTAEYTVNYKKTHSQTLLPMLDEVAGMIELDLKTVDAVAVAGGPGSFTGLRIGSATAKGLGLALDIPLIHIPTVDGLAFNLYETDKLVCPLMDARRNQVYTGIYTFRDGKFTILESQMAVSIDEVLERLNLLKREVIFLGDGVPVYKEQIKLQMKLPFTFAPVHLSRQRAGAVGALAMDYFAAGKTESSFDHKPDYLRLSQAERELAEKESEKELC